MASGPAASTVYLGGRSDGNSDRNFIGNLAEVSVRRALLFIRGNSRHYAMCILAHIYEYKRSLVPVLPH